MKNSFIFLLFAIISLAATSQPDLTDYYAASRYDYYSTEQTGQIMVLVPASRKGLNVTVDLVLEFNFLNRRVPVFPGHAMPVSFELERFKEGNNEVTVSFYENEKWVDSRKVNVLVRPGTSNEVKCDLLSGCLVTGGLPFFPVGFYCQWPVFQTLPEEEAVRGFNVMCPYWNVDQKSRKDRVRFMDRCAELGMKVNYNVCNVAAGLSRPGSISRKDQLALLEKEVLTVKDHPALLSWYLYDEPEGQGIPPDSLQAAYDLIKRLDPYHPVTIVFMAPHMAEHYAGVMDIAMTDPYPVPNAPILQVEEYVETLQRFFRYRKPVWVVPQAFGGNEWWTREPDPREVRAMTYLGLIHNASGIQYFIRKGLNGSPKSQAVWGECGAIAQEIMELLPSLGSGQPAPAVHPSAREIQARVINKQGMFTVIVVNTANKPMDFSLKIEDIELTMDIDVLFEGRKLPMTDGSISDIIDAYGTRLYRIDNRMKPDWLKDLERGNLTADPGFENIANAATPAACYAVPGSDRGATFFLDGRVVKQGDHSLRLTTPAEKRGVRLNFFGLELSPDQSYTASVWARKAPAFSPKEFVEHEIEIPDIEPDMMFEKESALEQQEEREREPASKKAEKAKAKQSPSGREKTAGFNLSLGPGNERQFDLTDSWTRYSFTTAGNPVQPSLAKWSMPGLELVSAGTAWFDLIQVTPDMELGHRAKSLAPGAGNASGEPGSVAAVQSEEFKIQSIVPTGLEIELRSNDADARIFYTLDGTVPSEASNSYSGPFTLGQSALVRAAAFKEGRLAGIIQAPFNIHRGLGATVRYDIPYEKYDGGGENGLVDGVKASDYYKDGNWQGFHGQNARFTMDLGQVEPVSEVRMNFLQDIAVWIFLPVDVTVSLSEDGISFPTAVTLSHDVPLEKRGAFIHSFKAEYSAVKARYVKVEAHAIGTCPSWHSGAGQPGWLFLDEVVVE